jgi:DNA-directed RNA polymerase specialized sigma24 family protein
MEKTLLAELGDQRATEEYRSLAASGEVLSGIPTSLHLIQKLHTPDDRTHNSSTDAVLLELLKYRSLAASGEVLSGIPTSLHLIQKLHTPDDRTHNSSTDAVLLELLKHNPNDRLQSMRQRLLLLVFIPTIHRTTSHVTATFPALTRDDVSQHVVCVFLEFLRSRELQTRQSHIAFTIARKLRRIAFRWAIRESRGATPEDSDGNPTTDAEDVVTEDAFHAGILLRQFLDSCQKTGWISREERSLLVQFKIEGVSCRELAHRNGHSSVAIQHRIQRLLDRLRRLAQNSPRGLSRQLELFPR